MTASFRSTTAPTEASARPTRVPVRSMIARGARWAARPVSSSIAGRLQYASRQPWPAARARVVRRARPPCGRCAPALPERPCRSRPPLMIPPLTPVATTTPMKSVTPCAAPHHASPDASALASVSTTVGKTRELLDLIAQTRTHATTACRAARRCHRAGPSVPRNPRRTRRADRATLPPRDAPAAPAPPTRRASAWRTRSRISTAPEFIDDARRSAWCRRCRWRGRARTLRRQYRCAGQEPGLLRRHSGTRPDCDRCRRPIGGERLSRTWEGPRQPKGHPVNRRLRLHRHDGAVRPRLRGAASSPGRAPPARRSRRCSRRSLTMSASRGARQARGHRLAVMCLLAEGHLLIEDVPGVGKTSLAKALAGSIDCTWKRVQFTPDLLPTDLVGVSVLQRATETFVFQPGPAVRQHRARRRDQPCLAEDPVGIARGDGGASGVGRGPHLRVAGTVHGGRHPEPGRAGGHLPAAREPTRPLPDAAVARLPRPPAPS